MYRCILVAAAILVGFLHPGAIHAEPRAKQWQDELPIRQPWLREHLPDGALAYLRVPQLFGLLATPKGNALDPALRSAVNVQNIQAIREGIVNNVLPHIPAFADLRLRMLEQHLRSPVEIATFFTPAPAAIITANLGVSSPAEFEEMMAAIALDAPELNLLQPLDQNGIGQLRGPGLPIFLQFDQTSGRVIVNAGPGVTASSFASLLQSLDRSGPHRMRAMETRVDESGQGLFFWVDAAQAMPAMQMFVQPEQFALLSELDLDKFTAVAFGWGVADGKGRLSLLADLPLSGDRGFFPVVSNDLSVRTVGEPDGLLLLSLPGPEEFLRMESLALAKQTDETRGDWQVMKDLFQEYTGATVEQAMAALGPDIAVIFDEAGDYTAVRLRDRKLWERMVLHLSDKAGAKPDQRQINGRRYFHLSTPNELAMMEDSEVETAGWFAVLMRRQRDHIYWTVDDDYLYLSSFPQVLIDRDAMAAGETVGTWLTNTQHVDASNALLSVSMTTEKLPQRMYGAYLGVLQVLADIAAVDIDLWSMPTAAQLQLPREGSLGITLTLGNPTIGAELVFENNPAEFLGGIGGIATAGILAAIAIPAYNDYTTRAHVASGLGMAGPAKLQVTEHYLENGAFPEAAAAAEMSVFQGKAPVQTIIVEANTGRIVIEFNVETIATGGQITLTPILSDDGQITWSCETTLPHRKVPAACRNAGIDANDV